MKKEDTYVGDDQGGSSSDGVGLGAVGDDSGLRAVSGVNINDLSGVRDNSLVAVAI